MKNTFFKSTIILLIGGCLTKLIGLFVKIIYTRVLKENGIALFSLVMPTYSLLMALANFNIQLSISKKISSENQAKKTVINACYIMFFLNLILLFGVLFSANFISNVLLKNKDAYYPLLACALTLPFISIGYIIKGYFYGKQNMLPHMVSNVLEQIFRLFIIGLILPKIVRYGVVICVTVLILFNILSESFSIFVFYFFLPKKFDINKKDLLFDKEEIKGLLGVCIPSISSRLIGNIGYFLEPVILTNFLLRQGLSISFISRQYGIYNAYAISTLLFPSFFIAAISNSLLPEISKLYHDKKIKAIKKRIWEAIFLSLMVGILCTGFIFAFRERILLLLYKTTDGANFIKLLAPFFILFYLEAPLSSVLIALNKVKSCTYISVTGIVLKTLFLMVFIILGFNVFSLAYAEIVNIIYITLLDIIVLKKELKNI